MVEKGNLRIYNLTQHTFQFRLWLTDEHLNAFTDHNFSEVKYDLFNTSKEGTS
ncbi:MULTISPECIES: hypothetical protein [unclassified Paenibacillus]|uniref:hypothetical protein n=1 Tax=unclassified Paenibacillus TaxID=185978 RepID=UPI0027856BB3|nr:MULTISPECIES: hypothetical protein [unclassified Paenibacillus]MDQ0901346.1 hypothetical protein [Paenibacillus sp. V4I7]MDQ0920155.1 hypothetical protein [Paenibacillus sp. V4I5]